MLQEIRDKIFEKESYKNCGQQYLKKLEWYSLFVHWNIWGKIFKNGPSKICGRQPLKNLKWYGFHRKNLYVKPFSVIFRAFIKIKFHHKSFLGNISKFFLEVLNNSFFGVPLKSYFSEFLVIEPEGTLEAILFLQITLYIYHIEISYKLCFKE